VISRYREARRKLESDRITKWSVDMLQGLEFMHHKRVIHFNIKPDILFLDSSERVKIGSLSLALDVSEIQARGTSILFTPCYASPQLINNENVNEKTDIW
jgi:serine/threonine protein kinase